LHDEHGVIIGTFGISRDITTLKQTEQELRQYRGHLEELVNARTAELTQMVTETKRLNSRLQEEIVERQRMEQVLRISEQQYRLLAENVRDGQEFSQGVDGAVEQQRSHSLRIPAPEWVEGVRQGEDHVRVAHRNSLSPVPPCARSFGPNSATPSRPPLPSCSRRFRHQPGTQPGRYIARRSGTDAPP
jgi:TolA-binding protein